MMLKNFSNYLKTIHQLKASALYFILGISFILTACSPHPGAGKWKADASNSLNVTTINIIFEGHADFYTDGKEESVRRCFWSAVAKQTMSLQCVYSENTDKKVTYQFKVIEKGHAELSQDGQLIGLFSLQKPEKEASFW
ncbi:MAG: hypothetical protein OQL19_13395 [Gammaproteobacteria bacterium]|nr:hypothetical protein [Gammaproteobacteria bacterium]